ncbi:histidine kinase [Pontibacter rugosus]|uniref:Histidine kinase n=1 Tax=Pontibacter rugosus TaxID=1745966 RepID=A0ABW3SQL2_9BACT
MELARLDFQQLRVKHIAHKSKVRAVLYGGGYSERYFQEDNPVSQWFSTVGSVKYSREAWFPQLYRLHRDFSVLAEELIKMYGSDLIEQAHEGLGELSAVSEIFLHTLSTIERQYPS